MTVCIGSYLRSLNPGLPIIWGKLHDAHVDVDVDDDDDDDDDDDYDNVDFSPMCGFKCLLKLHKLFWLNILSVSSIHPVWAILMTDELRIAPQWCW